MNILKTIISELRRPDSYKNDWYGYASNQLSHIALGFVSTCIIAYAYFSFFGEFPYKECMWIFVALSYVSFEIISQGWRGSDTIEDCVFFACYGAGMPTILFSEVYAGSSMLSVDARYSVYMIAIILMHLAGGMVARIMSRRDG